MWCTNDADKDHREHSVLLEGTQQFSKQAFYGRYEFVQKSTEELDLKEQYGDATFNIHKLTLGTNRKLFTARPIEFWGGVQASLNVPPNNLQGLYGKSPMSGQVYLQIRPKLIMH